MLGNFKALAYRGQSANFVIDRKSSSLSRTQNGLHHIVAEAIEAVRAASPIDEIIGEYVELRRSGHQLVSKCPFHAERTPSFYVNLSKEVFYCHGCQVGGDVFEFIKLLHRCDFRSAVVHLGQRAGISVNEFRPSPQLTQRVAMLRARRAAKDAFGNFCRERIATLSERYRTLGRSATWAERCLHSGNLDAVEREMAWAAIENYRLFELRVEREGLFDLETFAKEWQIQRGCVYGAQQQ